MNQQHRNFMSVLGPSAVNPAGQAFLGQNNNTPSGNMSSLPNVNAGGEMYPGYPGSGEPEGLSPWAKQMLAQLGYTEAQIMQWASVFGPPSPYAEPSNPEYLIQMLVDKEMIIGEDGRLCHTDGQGNVMECYNTPTTDPDDPDDPDEPDLPTKCGDWPKEIEGPDGVMVLDESTCSYGPKGGWDPDDPDDPDEPGGGCEDWEKEIVGPDNTIMVLDPNTCTYGPKPVFDDDPDPEPGGGDPERPQPGGPGGGLFPNPIEDMWWKMLQDAMSGDWVDDLNKFLKEEADRQSEAMRRDKDRDLVRDIMGGLGGSGDGSGSDRIGPVGLFNLATGGGGRYQDAKGEEGKGPVVSSGTVQATPQVPTQQISALGQTPAPPAAASTAGGSQQFSDILGGAAAPMQTQLTAALGKQANDAQFQEKSAHAQRGQDIASQVQQLGAQSDKLAQAKKRQKISQTMPLIQATLQGTDIFKNK